MALEAAFMADIIEYPNDDTPRLVYADWLDEQGREAQGEFIRTHVALSRMADDDVRYSAALAKCRRLRPAFLDQVPAGFGFERGMPTRYPDVREDALGLSEFFVAAPELFPLYPIREVTCSIDGGEEDVRAVAALTELGRLLRLRLLVHRRSGEETTYLRRLLESPHLVNLHGLWVYLQYRDLDCLPWLLEWDPDSGPSFENLDTLVVLARPAAITDGELVTLAESPRMRRLRRLSIGGVYDALPHGLTALFQAGVSNSLELLALEGSGQANAEVCQAVGRLLEHSHLRWLTLPGLFTRNADELVNALTGAVTWGRLTALDLSRVELAGTPLRRLLSCPRLAQLQHLYLKLTGLDKDDATALRTCPYLGDLRAFHVSSDYFQTEWICDLVTAAASLRPVHLSVDGPAITDDVVEAMTRSGFSERLRSLHWAATPDDVSLTDRSLVMLGGNRRFSQLATLHLGSHCELTSEGLDSFLRAAEATSLSRFSVQGMAPSPNDRAVLLDCAKRRQGVRLTPESRTGPWGINGHFDLQLNGDELGEDPFYLSFLD